ncbi:hypothetical protein MRS44_004386 [Fusarium solani]|uniref:uncharacterized protein n=1 Tax=Fusarium solani TaxID=169388 RepID=UPI0032C3E4DB|nr:hypothetical protein MRS44_004386 [Fusarium solani]
MHLAHGSATTSGAPPRRTEGSRKSSKHRPARPPASPRLGLAWSEDSAASHPVSERLVDLWPGFCGVMPDQDCGWLGDKWEPASNDGHTACRTVPYRTASQRERAAAVCYAAASSLAGSAISVACGQPHPSLWAGCMLRLTGGRASRTTYLLLGRLHWPMIAVPYPPYGYATSPLPAGGPVRSRMRRITEQHSNANRRSWLGWRRWLVKGKDGVGNRLAHVAKRTLRPSVLGVDSNYACFASYEAKPTRVSGAVYLPAAWSPSTVPTCIYDPHATGLDSLDQADN